MNQLSFTKVETFSYDWRRNPIDLSRQLASFIDSCSPSRHDHIKLIGHSLGGLIIRIMIEHQRALNELYIVPENVTVYQCGTPMYGSLNLNDYNYGFELAAILSSIGVFSYPCPVHKVTPHDIRKIKPFLFSVNDLKHIITKSSENYLYLLPTPVIKTIQRMIESGDLEINIHTDFDMVLSVHDALSRLSFPVKYVFFYNITCHRIEKVYMPFCTSDILTNLTVHDVRPGKSRDKCGVHLNRLLKTDGLVVPYSGRNVPTNCVIYVDESQRQRHAYLMNSSEWWRITMGPTARENFELPHERSGYNNSLFSPDHHLPGYDEVFTL